MEKLVKINAYENEVYGYPIYITSDLAALHPLLKDEFQGFSTVVIFQDSFLVDFDVHKEVISQIQSSLNDENKSLYHYELKAGKESKNITTFMRISSWLVEKNIQRDAVFIAIDGPAPRAKMEQQRHRRLKSSQEEKIWDTNAITPGTEFMEKLNSFLLRKIKEIPVKCILSDSNEPGEGEHKLMKFIDSTPLNTSHYVYGLDADLIMLSMIRKHSIHLLRERTEYNFEQTDDEYVSLSIPLLKTCLYETIHIPDIQLSKNHLIHDYLFLCFLLGNDFILNTPSINIRYNGIQTLLFAYKNLQRKYLGQFYLCHEI